MERIVMSQLLNLIGALLFILAVAAVCRLFECVAVAAICRLFEWAVEKLCGDA